LRKSKSYINLSADLQPEDNLPRNLPALSLPIPQLLGSYSVKGIICGYFKTGDNLLIAEGEKLDYLGEVKEERYIISIRDLKWRKEDWEEFLKEVELL